MINWHEYREWARRVSRRFRPTGILDREDYEAISELEAWKAAQEYDATRGASFKTYLCRRINQACLHAIRDTSGVTCWGWDKGDRVLVFYWADIDEDKRRAVADLAPNVEDIAIQRDETRRLWAEVEKLRDTRHNGIRTRQPEVLRRIYLDGQACTDIARDMGLCRAAPSIAHRTALKRLRVTLDRAMW